MIESWPSHPGANEGVSSVKVPTELRYMEKDNMEWGFQIPGLVDRYQWFKLYYLSLIMRCRSSKLSGVAA